MTGDWRTDRIGTALRGENPTVLRRLTAGFAVIGDVQFLPGYSVLLVDEPGVQRLSDLPRARRLSFPSERWSAEEFRLGPQHDALREAIGTELDRGLADPVDGTAVASSG
ncbi:MULTISPECIES: hypothetical protein [unclassified Streptomyces]|uniref:hypothetical protein n=1 Tax=unclassified Streptomyces TaxID=2593676 RepID=UPI0037F3939A